VLDLSAPAVLMAGLLLPVLVGVSFLTMRAAVLVRLPMICAGTRVNVSEVERVGLGKVAQVELDDDSVCGVLEGGGAAHPGVALGVQVELHAAALRMSSVVLLALGTTTGASDD
jgi:hypothetical protein